MTYKSQAIDTSEESDRYFFHLLQGRSPQQRLQMAAAMMQNARRFSLASLHQHFGELRSEAFARKVAAAWLQEDCPPEFTPTLNEMTWIQDSISLAGLLHEILTQLDISYYITGGVAAIAYGEPRTTRDLDMVLAVEPSDCDRLVAVLEASGFYVPGVEEVKAGRMTTLGITHMESIARADLVLSGNGEFDRLKFQRIRAIDVPSVGILQFISPEDIILSKLLWGRRSQSEKQWRDVLGVLKVQGDRLEFEYLRHWATWLELADSLDRALSSAGIEP
ncbi:MAG: hypothetical protein HC925_01915 [Coleofasciculaceae cyanobacterium SM2_3_26]|nr:hypothetical protein [Coleofasciculaceae cyanobacterium SM2_3_26]